MIIDNCRNFKKKLAYACIPRFYTLLIHLLSIVIEAKQKREERRYLFWSVSKERKQHNSIFFFLYFSFFSYFTCGNLCNIFYVLIIALSNMWVFVYVSGFYISSFVYWYAILLVCLSLLSKDSLVFFWYMHFFFFLVLLLFLFCLY